MHKKQEKLQSLIKKLKFRTIFQLSVYLHEFKSISLSKQGSYFVTATLCPKKAMLRDPNSCVSQNTFGKTSSSRVFHIKYNNHAQMISQCYNFSFQYQDNGINGHNENGNKLMLVFQLFRCKNQQSQQPERKLNQQYQSVAEYIFQIKTHEQLTFVQYFNICFQMPYAAEISGVATCLMTGFQTTQNNNLIQSCHFLSQNKIVKAQKLKSYFALVSYLKKVAKRHRFLSYSTQKILEQTYLGFHSTMTIPIKQKKSNSQTEQVQRLPSISLITQQNFNNTSNILSQQHNKLQTQLHEMSVSDMEHNRFKKYNERECNEQQFMNYLAFIQLQDSQVEGLLNQIKSLGRRNLEILKQISQCVSPTDNEFHNKQKQSKSYLVHKVIIQHIHKQHKQKRDMIYRQKSVQFQQSIRTAKQQMKMFEKNIAGLRVKQKQSYFTKMNQLFNLIPQPGQFDAYKYDTCPYVIYSNSKIRNGIENQQQQYQQNWDQQNQTNYIQNNNINQSNKIKDKKKKKQEYRNVFLLAHGYQASSGNMEKLKISFKKLFPRSKFFVLKSYSQCMDSSLEQMGKKAAKQIETCINQSFENTNKKLRIIMVGHSMGGIILRSTFAHLPNQIINLFHTFISFATPHLGYLNCKHFVTETGIKLIQSMHPSTSLKQLSNKDNTNIKQTYVYKLATSGSLKNFQNVIVVSSLEDKYVPWNSARIQIYKQAEGIGGKNTTGGWAMGSNKQYIRFVEEQMMKNVLGIGQKQTKIMNIHRFQVDFAINHINLDTMIGRTSHVAFLANQHLLTIIFQNFLNATIYSQLKSS